ncbi:MAG: hypothetical protein FWE16_05275 [Firmicutes bacterium]|nr:hypothetical protein [Bacillota bacterium]
MDRKRYVAIPRQGRKHVIFGETQPLFRVGSWITIDKRNYEIKKVDIKKGVYVFAALDKPSKNYTIEFRDLHSSSADKTKYLGR